MHHRVFVFATILVCLLSLPLSAAGEELAPTRVGTELRVYPAGVIASLQVEIPTSPKWTLLAGAGGNLTDRRDWGEHDDETGSGPGFNVGLYRIFEAAGRSWRAGVRADLWWLEIDWVDEATEAADARGGNTDVVVFQPTAFVGLRLGSSFRWTAHLDLSLGQEFNVDTEGEDVGEGPIALLGLRVLY